jgi:hypothetical protein
LKRGEFMFFVCGEIQEMLLQRCIQILFCIQFFSRPKSWHFVFARLSEWINSEIHQFQRRLDIKYLHNEDMINPRWYSVNLTGWHSFAQFWHVKTSRLSWSKWLIVRRNFMFLSSDLRCHMRQSEQPWLSGNKSSPLFQARDR